MDDTPKLPPAKVRRVFDNQPLAMLPPKLKLRPFTECFDRGAGMPALVMQATVLESELLVSITGRDVVHLAGSVSRDAHGDFIVLDVQEHPIGTDHALRLEADAEDPDGSHAALSYVELAGDSVARRELAYAERWYSVYFNPLGLVDGQSSGGPRSVAPRPMPS
jgi:hypothetical protein